MGIVHVTECVLAPTTCVVQATPGLMLPSVCLCVRVCCEGCNELLKVCAGTIC